MDKQAPADWTDVLGENADADLLWSALGAADAAAAPVVDVDAAWSRFQAAVAVPEIEAKRTGAKVVRMAPVKPRRRNFGYWAAAAAAIVAIMVGVNLIAGLGDTDIQFANGGNEAMPVQLPDASDAMLMPGSQLVYAERDGRREVVIDGEVGFDVTRREDMSFAVEADQLQILVMGTAFTVNHDGVAGVDVSEGHVRIRGSREADWTDVYAGGFARVADGLVTTSSPQESRLDELRFEDTSLSDILAALTDAHDVPFTASAALRSCRVTVNLEDTDAREAATTLAAVLGADAVDHLSGFYLRGDGCQ